MDLSSRSTTHASCVLDLSARSRANLAEKRGSPGEQRRLSLVIVLRDWQQTTVATQPFYRLLIYS